MKDSEKEMYLLHSNLPAFKNKVKRAIERIEAAYRDCDRWAVSFSGGKDSQVVLDLLYSNGYSPDVFYQSYGVETIPGNRDMKEWAENHYQIKIFEHECFGEIEVFNRVGHFFLEPTTKEEKAAVRWWWEQSFKAMDALIKEKCEGHFWGLRSAESSGRRMMIATNGSHFFNKSQGMWVAHPISDWTGRDVWAYIVSRSLQYCDIYDHPHFDREKARNEFVLLSGSHSIIHGAFKFWETYDPEWFAKVSESCPHLRAFI